MSNEGIFIGGSGKDEELLLKLANRHGLVTGATGTGKTVTLQILAEAELNGQKDRMLTYRAQARFALASIFDRMSARNQSVGQ